MLYLEQIPEQPLIYILNIYKPRLYSLIFNITETFLYICNFY